MSTAPHLQLVGEIIESCERDGRQHVRMALQSLCIDFVIAEDAEEVHLGEVIVIDAGIAVRRVTPLSVRPAASASASGGPAGGSAGGPSGGS